jgi:pyruvate,water dikinase
MKTTDKPRTHPVEENRHNDSPRFREWINRFNEDGSANADGFALTDAAFRHFLAYNRLEGRHSVLLRKVHNDYSNLETIGREAREIILHLRIPQDLADAILFSYRDVYRDSKPLVAVMSAANDQGLHDYLLNVREENLVRAVKQVYASLYTDRAITFYLRHPLNCDTLSMPVLVEKMSGL